MCIDPMIEVIVICGEEQQDIPGCENEELITSNSDQPRNLFERFEELFEDGTTE